jgi:hypothetical protein
MSERHETAWPSSTASTFEWHAALGPWRWLILGTLGVAPNACGGRAGTADTDRNISELQGQAGATAEQTPSPGAGGTASGAPTLPVGATGPLGRAPAGPPRSAYVVPACELASTLEGNWELCTNGMLHRRALGSCTSALPRAGIYAELQSLADPGVDAGAQFECLVDDDCSAAPHGHCEIGQGGPYCAYGCVTDADCGDSRVCLCGPFIGECISADCSVDGDCGGSSLCGSYEREPSCGGIQFGCQTPEDQCAGNADCGEFGYCVREVMYGNDGAAVEAPYRSCNTSLCVIGRPFLIDGAERLAPCAVRQDWYTADPSALPLRALTAASEAVARGWLEQALMEHASVASFARFSLQLLQLGAPAELVAAAAAAMQDEIRHARACFELARRHTTEDVGPGPLVVDGALDQMDPASIVLAAVREGCMGETVAAIEASEALSHCEDAAARAVLERIAIEEGQHAELAWRFVAWALETRPELAPRVREAFELEIAGARPGGASAAEGVAAADRELARHGILSSPLRAALRTRVLAGVVAPCAEALLAGAGWQRPDASPTRSAPDRHAGS